MVISFNIIDFPGKTGFDAKWGMVALAQNDFT